MAEFKHGTITVTLPDDLMPPTKAGKMDALEVARIPKAPVRLRSICNDVADAIEKAGDKFAPPTWVSAETMRKSGRRSEDIEHVIRDCEVVLNVLKQANLLFDHDAYEQLRKVNDQVKAQAKHSPDLWGIFDGLSSFFSKLRKKKLLAPPTAPAGQAPAAPATEQPSVSPSKDSQASYPSNPGPTSPTK